LDWFSEVDPFNSHITCNVAGLSLYASSAFRCVLESTSGRSDLPALLIVSVEWPAIPVIVLWDIGASAAG